MTQKDVEIEASCFTRFPSTSLNIPMKLHYLFYNDLYNRFTFLNIVLGQRNYISAKGQIVKIDQEIFKDVYRLYWGKVYRILYQQFH